MNSHRIIATAAALSALALAPTAAHAQDAPPLELKGAYAYVNTLPSKQKFVQVVFRTKSPIARRGDGALQAALAIDGLNHSIGTAKRGTRCYTGASEIKNGTYPTIVAGKVVRKRAKVGSPVIILVSDRSDQGVSMKLKLRAERRGDDTGRPLGC